MGFSPRAGRTDIDVMNRPLVSVIMNCLDGERYLPAALASLKSQTFQDFEIIFWDNGSRDASADIAQAFGPRLRYCRGAETVPLGAARNLAIAEARGELIAFLDCDDLWRADKLARQVELFEANPRLGLVCTDTEVCRGTTLLYRMFDHAAPARGMVFEQLMLRQWISMSSAMVGKKALDSIVCAAGAEQPGSGSWFDEGLNVCEEADVFYRIAHDWELDFVDEPLTVWRVHGANTTFEKFGQFGDETLRILAKHRLIYKDYDQQYPAVARELTMRAAFQQGVALWRAGNNSQARKKIAPYMGRSRKFRLFWLASFLPGSAFDSLATLYFSLPAWFRRFS